MIRYSSAGFFRTSEDPRVSVVCSKDEISVFSWLSSALALGQDCNTTQLSAAQMRSLAFLMYQGRRDRDRFFPSGLFSDPAWDLLLAAYCLPKAGSALSVTALCHAGAAPPTTALRWVTHLCDIDMLSRKSSTTDHRVTFVSLTSEGKERIERYLNRFSRRLLPPGS
jgi:DNA-binding MarR family transcriptional regulator